MPHARSSGSVRGSSRRVERPGRCSARTLRANTSPPARRMSCWARGPPGRKVSSSSTRTRRAMKWNCTAVPRYSAATSGPNGAGGPAGVPVPAAHATYGAFGSPAAGAVPAKIAAAVSVWPAAYSMVVCASTHQGQRRLAATAAATASLRPRGTWPTSSVSRNVAQPAVSSPSSGDSMASGSGSRPNSRRASA